MNRLFWKVKDKLYYYLVDKNWGVGPEYHRYVDTHQEEHINNRWKSWLLLLRLNWHYRVLRKTETLLKNNVISKNSNKTVKNNVKLPYLDGSESEAFKRRDAIHFAKDLLQYDVISFDIFDTLILRPFAKPVDIFMIVGKRLNKIEFTRIRVDAEKRAREMAMIKNGNTEVTIDDIYTIIEERTGIPKWKGIKTELETEMDYCFANPYIKRVYDLVKEQNKKIIIASDMYIPQEMMEKLLDKVGFDGYEKLYVSCDYNCSKRNGNLYQYILRDYPNTRIVHIGDNSISDVKSANEAGIETRYYKNCHEIGNQFRADGMSELVGSAYAGIVNTHLHNGNNTYSPYYEYGFIYGGLYILGFCNWMHKKAKAEGIDKILFLSRDGDIYQKVFNQMFDDVPNEYFLWSRIANTKYTVRKNREDFMRRCVYYRSLSTMKISIDSLLKSLDLYELEKFLPNYGLTADDLVIKENVKIIEQLFIDKWDVVCQLMDKEQRFIREYIKQKIGRAKNIAFVDVGWMGSGAMGLKYLIEDEFAMNCKVFCWQAAARPPVNSDIMAELLDNTIEAYIFSRMYNRNLFDVHKNTNKGLNNIFFEMFTQATYPSYSGMDKRGELNFDIVEIENYKIIRSIQNGIMDFTNIYNQTFRKDEYILNVAGYDAYCPYRMIIRNLKWIKIYFGKLTYARGISGDNKKQSLENLREVILKSGV